MSAHISKPAAHAEIELVWRGSEMLQTPDRG